ncbi:prepilin peptidase [Pasteurella sp. PK-2025]|uniref:prepilin peptidase n=1 Tax=Pasteurella sp. PK-2025 TaxID=3413133 RepID=UPI003C7074BF
MNWILLLFLSTAVAYWVYYQLTHFTQALAKEIYQAYHAVFLIEETPRLFEQQAMNIRLQRIKCGHFWQYFVAFTGVFFTCYFWREDFYQAVHFGLYFSLLFYIAALDWHYHLISPQSCQGLLVLGVVGSWFGLNGLSIEESIQSALIGFLTFYILYWLAKCYYRQEALGRGDYWLMLGLGSMLHWQHFPLLVLIACIVGLGYVLWGKYQQRRIDEVPFGSFLCVSEAILLVSQ